MLGSVKFERYFSFLYLLFGFAFLFFANGRWTIPLATFLAPIFLVRFIRLNKAFKGFLFLLLAGFISNIFIWKGLMPVSGLFYFTMTFMMALFTALVFLIDRIISQRLKGLASTLVLPCAFVLMDYISVMANPGGTFGAVATTQSSLPLLQLISITGIWGITFVIYWTASIVNWLLDTDFEKHALRKAFWSYLVPIMMVFFYGQFYLSHNTETKTVKIASVNIPREFIQHIFSDQPDSVNAEINDLFLANCDIAAMSNAKIVFGNEIMLNMHAENEEEYINRAKAVAVKNGIYIGLPLLIYEQDNPNARPKNKISWISPQGEMLFAFYKAKPTPGEGDYGDGLIRHFDSPYGRISSVICFDMDFLDLMQQAGPLHIDIMLVPGNDWQEITPYHTHAASFRGIEQGFNLVRSASRGLSASFNYKGQLLSCQDYFNTQDTLFYSDVPTKGRHTVYALIEDLFAWICIAYFFSVIIFLLTRRRG